MYGDASASEPDIIRREVRELLISRAIWRSPSLMLMFSSIARAGSQLLPVLVMYAFGLAEEAAFWLLMAGIIGLQSLLFLGAPQVLIRMLAYSSAKSRQDKAAWPETEESPVLEPEERVAPADLVFLMARLFLAASIILPLLIALGGSLAIANVVKQTGLPLDSWMAWGIAVALSPIRIAVLRHLTFLHGMSVIVRPRLIDGASWVASGLLAALVFALTRSLTATSLASQLPILVAIVVLRGDARAAGWLEYKAAAIRANWRRTFTAVWQPAWRAGVGQSLSLGARQGSGIVLAQYVAAADVAGFLMAMNVAVVVMMLGGAPFQAALPRISRAYALGRTVEHCAAARTVLVRSLWLVAIACGAIGLALIPFLGLIGAEDAFVSSGIWLLIALTLFAHRYGAVYLHHYSITNHIFWHWLEGATGAINIVACLVLIPSYGIWGAAVANLASVLCLYLWVPGLYVRRRFAIAWPGADVGMTVIPLGLLLGSILAPPALAYIAKAMPSY